MELSAAYWLILGARSVFAKEEEENDDAYAQDTYFPAHGVASDEHADRASVRDEEDYGRGGRTLKVSHNHIFYFTPWL